MHHPRLTAQLMKYLVKHKFVKDFGVLSFSILEKDNFIKNLYIALSCLIK